MRIRNIAGILAPQDITALDKSARLTFIGLGTTGRQRCWPDDVVAIAADLYRARPANDVACTLQQISCDLHAPSTCVD